MLRGLKDFAKLYVFPNKLSSNHYESCLDDKKIAVLLARADEALDIDPRGSLAEFGVARGGSTCLLSRLILTRNGAQKLYGFDSFEGFDVCEANATITDAALKKSFSDIQFGYVHKKLSRLGLEKPVTLVKGYFQDTLPVHLGHMGRITFAFIDCDLPNSLHYCATTIWPNVAPGGFILFDDYCSPEYGVGVKHAVDAFVAAVAASVEAAYESGGLFVVKKIKQN